MLSKWVGGGGGKYFNAVWDAVNNSESYSRFRRHPDYNTILEHVTKEEGQRYLEMLHDPLLIDICRQSADADTVGSPLTFDYLDVKISPTTLRYAKVAQDMSRFFTGFSHFRSIAEIGVGYGGQIRVISEYLKRKGSNINRFTLIDMLPVVLLAQSYLDNFDMVTKCEYLTKSQIDRNSDWDFVFSNYAFAEFDRDLQDEYMRNVIQKSKSGYLTMNTGFPGHTEWNRGALIIHDLLRMLPNAVIAKDEPVTVATNYIIVFGEHSLGKGLPVDEFLRGKG